MFSADVVLQDRIVPKVINVILTRQIDLLFVVPMIIAQVSTCNIQLPCMIKLLRFLSVAYNIKLLTKKITFSIQTLKFQKLTKITVTNKLEQYGTLLATLILCTLILVSFYLNYFKIRLHKNCSKNRKWL
jgi:hypothetical protein